MHRQLPRPRGDVDGADFHHRQHDLPGWKPTGANCAQYTLVVPASNPSVGVLAAAGRVTFSAPASGDVLFSVDANAFVAMSGGTRRLYAIRNRDFYRYQHPAQPLKVTLGTTANVARTDFTGCT